MRHSKALVNECKMVQSITLEVKGSNRSFVDILSSIKNCLGFRPELPCLSFESNLSDARRLVFYGTVIGNLYIPFQTLECV